MTRTLRDAADRVLFFVRFGLTDFALLGLIGHPFYWFVWTYIIEHQQDSLALRLSAATTCIPMLFSKQWPEYLRPYLGAYIILTIIYVLPVVFTYLALTNQFDTVSLLGHCASVLFLGLVVVDLAWYLIMLISGTLGGFLIAVAHGYHIDWAQLPPSYLPICIFCFLAVVIAIGKMREMSMQHERDRTNALKILSATIAHEVRKPIAQSRQALGQLRTRIQDLNYLDPADDRERLLHLAYLARTAELGYSSAVRGDMLIGIILRNIREERIDPSDFQVLSIGSIVDSALESYAFSRGQRERVRVVQAEDFSVRGDENLLIYVLFNLLQNALVFDAGRPDLTIGIRFGRDGDGDGGWLSVRDNGPGIPAERLPGIFESFMTYANKQGTGLGLPFCKRVMTALGGGIDVRSTPGEGTEFRLRFPPVTASAPVPAEGAVPSGA